MLLYVALVCGIALNLLEFGVCCSMLLYFAACYSTLLYFVVLLEFARGGSMLHVMPDVAICVCIIPSILLDVAVLLFCLSLLCVGHVVVCFDNVYVALCCVYSAACYSTLLYVFFVA